MDKSISDDARRQAAIDANNASEVVSSISKGERIHPSVTAWFDLLNFRSHIDLKNWDMHAEETQLGLKRIAGLHEVALHSMHDDHEVVQLNDAVVISRDIPPKETARAVEEFLARLDARFEAAVLADYLAGGAGVRGVISTGVRYNLRGNLGWTSEKADPKRPAFFSPRPVMMNTAFGRAYGVESSHKLKKASSLYVEKKLLHDFGARLMEYWSVSPEIVIDPFGVFVLVREIKADA